MSIKRTLLCEQHYLESHPNLTAYQIIHKNTNTKNANNNQPQPEYPHLLHNHKKPTRHPDKTQEKKTRFTIQTFQ